MILHGGHLPTEQKRSLSIDRAINMKKGFWQAN